MHALLTGATGFIGSHLIDELKKHKYTITALCRKTSDISYLRENNITCIPGDVTNPQTLQQIPGKFDIIFHIAAFTQEWGPKKQFHSINVTGTKNLLEFCVHKKIPRFIYMSSCSLYGFPNTPHPINETHPIKPAGIYGTSKHQAEQLIWNYGKQHNLFVSAVRSPIVIGPRDQMILPYIINMLTHNKFIYIGTGNNTISISDARDVAQCLRKTAENTKANKQAYNVKSFDATPTQLITHITQQLKLPQPTRHINYSLAYFIATLIELKAKLLKQKPQLTRHKIKVLGTTRLIDIKKAKTHLKYKPTYTLEKTINDSITGYKNP